MATEPLIGHDDIYQTTFTNTMKIAVSYMLLIEAVSATEEVEHGTAG